MQVITFAHETISICKRLHRDGSSNPELVYCASHLSTLSAHLRSSIDNTVKQKGSLNKQEKELQGIANECYRASTALQAELSNIANPSVGSHRTAIRATLKNVWRKSDLEKLEKTMVANQRLLETKLLEQLYMNVINTQRDIEIVDKDVKYFIEQYAQGRRQISQLILDQGESVKAHVTSETEKLRQDLDMKFDNVKLIDINQDLVARVLGSLKDTSTNLRRNQIAESHYGTFEWIFDEDMNKPWDSFAAWLTSDDRLYWISGKPGSGKSTLMKFIINETRTQDALNGWHRGCAVLSGFLWRSGHEIQRSRKGLLSTLLYQLLSGQTTKVMEIVSVHGNIANKTRLSDWSTTELADILFDSIVRSDDYICIFIDGLDETGPEDDVYDLVKLVGTLKDQPKVKVCVSSRPERPFQLAFGTCTRLKLQDLTASDIRHYIAGFLQPQAQLLTINDYPDNALPVLTSLIAEKADVVFLWVELVLRSVRTGFANGDDWGELLQRLQLLPSNLHELYNQMWQRLNDDEPIYRKEAAFYFNATIDSKCIPTRSPLILAVPMALRPPIVSTILDSRSRVSPDMIAKLCLQTVNRIPIRSAGLLEPRIVGKSSTDSAQILNDLPRQGTRDQLQQLFKVKVFFVHRTVRDFLQDTEEGREILQHDEITLEAQTIRFLKALVAGAVALHCPQTAEVYVPAVEDFLGILHNLHWFMSGTMEKYRQWEEVVILLQNLFHHHALSEYSKFDFLGLTASYGFHCFVSKSVMELEDKALVPPGYENYLLCCATERDTNYFDTPLTDNRDIVMARRHAMLRTKNLVEWLLERGADPNRKFLRYGQFLWECTPFMNFLGGVIIQLRNVELKQLREVEYDWFLNVVKTFIEAGANLDSVGYVFHGKFFESYAFPYEGQAEFIPVFLSEMNAAHVIQEILETFHNTDAELAPTLDHDKFVAAKKPKRITLAARGAMDFKDHLSEAETVLDLKFSKLVAVTDEDSMLLTNLVKTNDWRDHKSGLNPFEQREFEDILQRGRPVDLIDYMEQVGVFLPSTEGKEDYPPRLPGEPQTKRYTELELLCGHFPEGQYPPHTWFQD